METVGRLSCGTYYSITNVRTSNYLNRVSVNSSYNTALKVSTFSDITFITITQYFIRDYYCLLIKEYYVIHSALNALIVQFSWVI